jgi:NAD-dependent SIR2 family protein deacetylase
MHQSICPYFTVPCIYCMSQVPRIEMTSHEQNTCKGTHNCQSCGLIISKDEVLTNSHNCFNTLTEFLQKLVEEKDSVIYMLKEEVEKKNSQITRFIER